MTDGTMSALVVGAGSIGRRHATNLRTLGVNVAAVDSDSDALNDLSAETGLQATYESLPTALDEENPEFVVVATPNNTHVDIATAAAEADCHLFIEKPIAHEWAGVDDLVSLIHDRGLISLIGCNLRFNPEIRKMHSLLAEGIIGDIIAARIEGGSYLPEWFPNSDYTEAYSAQDDLGGGVVLDYIHEINYARWFFGEFEQVSAVGGQRTHLDIETNDVAGILADTTNDTVCEFHLDYIQRSYSRSCHIVGEAGTIRWSWSEAQVSWYIAKDDEWYSYDRPDEWEMNDMYLDEMKHFIECIRTGDQSTCPVASGRQDLAVALAARKSMDTGERVTLNE